MIDCIKFQEFSHDSAFFKTLPNILLWYTTTIQMISTLRSHSNLSAIKSLYKKKNHQTAFRIRLTAGFQVWWHAWQTVTRGETRPHHKMSEKFQFWRWLRIEAARPRPDSCPSLNHINPNYRHCPLKPKYYSQAWLLAPQLCIGCVFHPLDLCKGVQCAKTF